MIPGEFDYHSPKSLQEAVALLQQHGDDAKLLAGGQSLIPAMRFRLALPEVLIDINGIAGLEYVREDNGRLAIGAMTREVELEESAVVQQKYHLLADAAHVIADPIVRNRATVGGNIAHADPANDHPAVMLAYGAEVIALGPAGTRAIPIDDFFVDLFENALTDNEILTEVRIPAPGANSGGAYIKVERKVGDYAISAVAVQLTMSGDVCTAVRIGLTNVSPVPMRAKNAEAALQGKAITPETLEAAGQAAAAECDPSPDLRGTEAYKRDLTRVLVKRAVQKAMERANQ
ncbi:MAG: xanthine dehydrogenase family protein subunit M [Ardenticatenaceae bacterium]|nr:xanthine dehydrogenase family protein subunit M [Anaerolineales bacterium]MCB8939704.1 xanthine dehydrogenase family protein subunit M [Ardenticatenaceae bacterium]MCB8975212.1 xanthine dehydrogenase family protein subunit M [Ardenticatenaceae bacterium]